MRPDGELHIVPAGGGPARRMRCNTPLMNSWHSFSPNGRWMVFSSKSRSRYTQMFLTHIDDEGNDSPAILIENATAANRAVNIPEFVNIPQDGMLKIDAPAAEFYRLYDRAWELTASGDARAAMAEWTRALALDPDDAKANNNFGALLLREGRLDEAVPHLRRALESNPGLLNARDNLGLALMNRGMIDEAIAQWQVILGINPGSVAALVNLGNAYLLQGKHKEALAQWREACRLEPDRIPILDNIAWMLATCPDPRVRNGAEAVKLAERAVELSRANDLVALDALGAAYAEVGRFAEAAEAARRALGLAARSDERPLIEALKGRIALYAANKPFRERPAP
jgi:tetratricopeptide (TPR) repeat protein